jgi:hypothetical protein
VKEGESEGLRGKMRKEWIVDVDSRKKKGQGIREGGIMRRSGRRGKGSILNSS